MFKYPCLNVPPSNNNNNNSNNSKSTKYVNKIS